MKLQHATTSGHVGLAVAGGQLAQSLPRDTGEWLAVLNSASGTSVQDISLTQDELIERISFQESRATIEATLLASVGGALSALTETAAAIFGADFRGLTRQCEYDAEQRECLIRARVTIKSTSSPEVLYERYQRLIDAVATARNTAGTDNLDVDIRLD